MLTLELNGFVCVMSDVMVATFFQTKLMNMAESISNKLSYFNALDHLRHVSVYNSSLVLELFNRYQQGWISG